MMRRRFSEFQEERGVVVRGLYDVAGLRADAFMIWTHAERVEALQATYADFRRTTTLGRACSPVWSSVALHRPAEFNKSHIPAFLAGEEPGAYICVYPFVRSYEWYLLPDEERRRMLAEHGMAAREYKDVRANRAGVRARRLRMGPGLRGARTGSHRRPDARAACHRRPTAYPCRDAVFHRSASAGRATGERLAVTGT